MPASLLLVDQPFRTCRWQGGRRGEFRSCVVVVASRSCVANNRGRLEQSTKFRNGIFDRFWMMFVAFLLLLCPSLAPLSMRRLLFRVPFAVVVVVVAIVVVFVFLLLHFKLTETPLFQSYLSRLCRRHRRGAARSGAAFLLWYVQL